MVLSFSYDLDRASQALLWLIRAHGGAMEKIQAIKMMFFADRLHLARYGRPITGGHYVAMKHGPVASELLDSINRQGFSGITMSEVILYSEGKVNYDELSESDIEVLREVYDTYGDMDKWHLRDLTHHLRCWKEAYGGGGSSYSLPYEDFFKDLKDGVDYDKTILELLEEEQEVRDFLQC